jgi:hypothetical protein
MSNVSLNATIEAIQDEAVGVFGIDIVRPGDFAHLMSTALEGNLHAMRVARAVASTVAEIGEAPPDKPRLCASCTNALSDIAFSVVLVTPEREDPTNALGMGICAECATTIPDINAKAVEALKRIWPNSRGFTVDHPAGRA